MDEFTKWFEGTHLANISQEQLFNSIVCGLLNENERVSALKKYLSELKVIETFHPDSNTLLKKCGVAAKFRNLIRDFVADSSKVSNKQIEDVFTEHNKEFHDISKRFSSKNIPSSTFQRNYRVNLRCSYKGFLTSQAEKVIRVYDEKLLNNLPKYWLDIPLSGEATLSTTKTSTFLDA